MIKDIKISVIIPTYKPAAYLWDCLTSLKNQTFPKDDFEIIIGINGCNEPYKSLISQFVKDNLADYNVIILQSDDAGASIGRNMGLDNALGDYIAFVDDDDYVSITYLDELFSVSAPDIVGLSNAVAFEDETNIKVQYCMEDAYLECRQKSCNCLNSKARRFFNGPVMKLFHKSVIGNRRFDNSFKTSQDCIFNFLISDRIDKVAFTSSNAIYYRRIRANSATTRARTKKRDIANSLKCMAKFTKIYFSGDYSTYFFITRLAAEVRYIVYKIFSK